MRARTPDPMLPVVLEERRESPAHAEIDIALPAELLYFRGHFEGSAVLPGVVQLHWALHYARRCLGLGPGAARRFQVKYRELIRPGERRTLVLRHMPEKHRLSFEYRQGSEARSSGQVTLAP